MYSRTPLFRTRLIRSPRYFEGRSNALGFTLPLYASPVISRPRYFGLFVHFLWDLEIAGFDCIIKQLLDSVFGYIVNNQGLGKCYQPRLSARLITLTSTLIIPDITKTSSNNFLLSASG